MNADVFDAPVLFQTLDSKNSDFTNLRPQRRSSWDPRQTARTLLC